MCHRCSIWAVFVAAALTILFSGTATGGNSVLIMSSRVPQQAQGAPPTWNLWLPSDTFSRPVASLISLEAAEDSAGAPYADTSLRGTLSAFGVSLIRRAFDPARYQQPVMGPLGPLDLSWMEQLYSVQLADSVESQVFIDSVNRLQMFYAEPAVPDVALDSPDPPDPMWVFQDAYMGTGKWFTPSPARLYLPYVWDNYTLGDTAVVVGVLDNGMRRSHNDFIGRSVLGSPGLPLNHGTSVAGIIGGVWDSFGMAGVMKDVTLAFRSVNCGTCTGDLGDFFAERYVDVIALGSQVTNSSFCTQSNDPDDIWPGSDPFNPERNPREYIVAHLAYVSGFNSGIVNCASAGNHHSWSINPPGSYDECVLAFTAVAENGQIVTGCKNGAWTDYGMPGENIVAPEATSDAAVSDSFGYTSAAAALGSGLAGLAMAWARQRAEVLDMDDIRGIFDLGRRWLPSANCWIPRLDSSLRLMSHPNSFERYTVAGGWQQTSSTRTLFPMAGILGLPPFAYYATQRVIKAYVPFPEDYYQVYGVWANGPRSNGAMWYMSSVGLVPAQSAKMYWWDNQGCSTMTCYYTNICSIAGYCYGDYPFSVRAEAHVEYAVAGQKRLPALDAHARFLGCPERIEFWTANPENDERIVVDLKVGASSWQQGYRILTGVDTSFSMTGLQGSQTYSFRAHAETYNQIGATGALATVVQRPDTLIINDVADTIGSPGAAVPVSVFLHNLTDSIQAFELSITLSRPDLMAFVGVPFTVENTLIQNWDAVEAQIQGSTNVRITAVADLDHNHSPLPILPFTNGVLIKVIAQVNCDVPDTLTNRTVIFQVDQVGTCFTDPKGDMIRVAKLINGSITVPPTMKGDLDNNQIFNVIDVVKMINIAFRGGTPACPPGNDDLNCDTHVTIQDIVLLVGHLFRGNPRPNC